MISSNQIRSLLGSALSSARLLVVGDVMLDEYLIGSVTRVSPEAPVPIVEIRSTEHVAGGAGNVAANVASLGSAVKLLAVTGRDNAADRLRAALRNAGVDIEGTLIQADGPTTCKTRVIAGQQQIVRFDVEDRTCFDSAVQASLLRRFDELLAESDLCIISDYGKGVISDQFCAEAISRGNRFDKPVIVDPKGIRFEKYLGCTLVTPNQKEAIAAAGGVELEGDAAVIVAGRHLLARLPGSAVLVTRGSEGMTLFRCDASPLTIPTEAQTVYDVVGAGDTAVATLGVAMAAGLSLEIAISLANIAAGVAVGKRGTVAVTANEIMNRGQSSEILERALQGRLCA